MRLLSLASMFSLVFAVTACGGTEAESSAATTTTSTTNTPITTSAPTTTASTTTTTLTPGVTLPRSSVFVTTVGLGPIRIGMTVEAAAEAAGFELVGDLDPDVSETCYHVVPPEDELGYSGIAFMVENDKIVRIEVGTESSVTTRSGAQTGTTEDELRAMFPDQIEDATNTVLNGRAVQFVPRNEEDSAYRVIFVVDEEGTVTHYRAGILPAVSYREGCH